MVGGSVRLTMLLSETFKYLPRRIERSLAPQLVNLPGTDRLPRYRIMRNAKAMDSLVGTTVAGKYYVLSILGQGGMSVVYKAKKMRSKRPLAVKTLRTQGLSDEVVVKRFQREAELLSRLNHPRIVQVHDYGYTKRGQPYFVMDYLVGRNLGQLIREGPLPADRVKYIFTQVCSAVDHAHRCGVIHRDLKPGNIMLLRMDGEHDFVKVVDFGIARFQSETNRLTRLGEVWGSPVYMSPEQCMGKALDARSDVYSVGIAMYEALTTQVPFLGTNYVDTMALQINEAPMSFREIAPDVEVPPSIEAVVMKALKKDPLERHQSMAELRDDIEDAFAQLPKSFKISRQRVPAAVVPAVDTDADPVIPPRPSPQKHNSPSPAPKPAGRTKNKLKAAPAPPVYQAKRYKPAGDGLSGPLIAVITFGVILLLLGCFAYGYYSSAVNDNDQQSNAQSPPVMPSIGNETVKPVPSTATTNSAEPPAGNAPSGNKASKHAPARGIKLIRQK